MKEVKVGMARMGVRLMEEGRGWILSDILHANDLALCGESEEDLKVMVRRFVEVCKKRGLQFNANKSMVMC